MSFVETFLKYHNAGINWTCSTCGQTMAAVVGNCVRKCKGSVRPFSIVLVVSYEYFDGVEERWRKL